LHALEQINTDELLNSNSPIDGKVLDFDNETLASNLNIFHDFGSPQPMIQFHPPAHFSKLPEVEELANNPYDFHMELKHDTSNKSNWLYSSPLNKVFVKIDTPLNVYPTFNTAGHNKDNFFIRAMIVYTAQNDLPEPVVKCPNHRERSQKEFPDHILHCASSEGVTYSGIPNGKLFGERLSFVVAMEKIASNAPLKIEFSCQNSCSGGMNRKSTTLVFTLEDQFQTILGRKVMHFKVCSCPRRDKEKDEQSSATKVLPKKRKLDNPNAASTSAKRIQLTRQDSDMSTQMDISNVKLEPDSQCELKLNLPNENIRKEVLRYAYNAIAGEMNRTGQMGYNHYLTEIQKQIGK
jgi:hypothetical protein